MSWEREMLATARKRLDALNRAPWIRRDCDGCGRETWWAENEDEEFECFKCAISRVEGMADAVNDVAGRAEWEARHRAAGMRFAGDEL